jgi:hypothetical protein
MLYLSDAAQLRARAVAEHHGPKLFLHLDRITRAVRPQLSLQIRQHALYSNKSSAQGRIGPAAVARGHDVKLRRKDDVMLVCIAASPLIHLGLVACDLANLYA